jgi:hypothetical protein
VIQTYIQQQILEQAVFGIGSPISVIQKQIINSAAQDAALSAAFPFDQSVQQRTRLFTSPKFVCAHFLLTTTTAGEST